MGRQTEIEHGIEFRPFNGTPSSWTLNDTTLMRIINAPSSVTVCSCIIFLLLFSNFVLMGKVDSGIQATNSELQFQMRAKNRNWNLQAERQQCLGKYCWGHGLSISEVVDVHLAPWIEKGGITSQDIERTRQIGCVIVDTNGKLHGGRIPYVSRALNALPQLHPAKEICLHMGKGDWPKYPIRESDEENGWPLALIGSSHSDFLDIILPFSYGGRDAYGSKYEKQLTSLYQLGLRTDWSSKKNKVIWRGSVGCAVGCGKRGDLYFPENHVLHCSDDRRRWNADKAGYNWGCDMGDAGRFHPRVQLVNISLHRPKCVDARFTSLNEHKKIVETFFPNVKSSMGKRISEEDMVNYRYVVNVQNNGFADRLWRLLALGLVVLQEQHAFKEFYYEMLIPWVHYIPISTDMTDLCEKIAWAKANSERSRVIGDNARRFVYENMSLANVNLYVATLVHRLGELAIIGHSAAVSANYGDDDVEKAPFPSQCSKIVASSKKNKNAFGFGNRFLAEYMKDEINATKISYVISAWEPLHWESDESYASFWSTVSSNGKLKEHLVAAAGLDKQCAFDPKAKSESIEHDTQKIAAVHFRCSDVPINYAKDYPLAPPEYSSFIGKKFRDWGIKRIVPLLCVRHHVGKKERHDRQEKCEELFNLQLSIIKREMATADYDIYFDEITCLPEKTTLMAIRDLGASAILVPSSFVFPAGLTREDSKFIMPHFGVQGVSPADVLLQSKINHEIILRMQKLADAMPVTVFCPRCGNDIADTPEGVTQWSIEVSRPILEKYARKGS